MTVRSGNLFADIPDRSPEELFTTLIASQQFRLERIVSRGHASPAGSWYDQPEAEWVIVLTGSATIQFEGEAAPRALQRGDWVHIPEHVRHRVESTNENEPTVWLALHHG